MADKFMSGATTSKFEVPLPSNVADSLSSISDTANELRGQLASHDQALQELNYSFSRISEIAQDNNSKIDKFEGGMYDSKYIFNPLLIQFLLSWPMRFLNNIFHWYTLHIIKEKYSDIVNDAVCYYINIIPASYYMYTTQQITPGKDFMSEEYNAEVDARWHDTMKLFKNHSKQAKEDGWNLKKIIRYTCIHKYS